MGSYTDPIAQFVSHVVFTDSCWLWTGGHAGEGYGRFYNNGRAWLAHRFAWIAFVGPIEDGLQLDHVAAAGCKNRHCVNPDHLEPVTIAENVLRGSGITAINARKTHCKQGHPFDRQNTIYRKGGRLCRQCKAMWAASAAKRRTPEQRARLAAKERARKALSPCSPAALRALIPGKECQVRCDVDALSAHAALLTIGALLMAAGEEMAVAA